MTTISDSNTFDALERLRSELLASVEDFICQHEQRAADLAISHEHPAAAAVNREWAFAGSLLRSRIVDITCRHSLDALGVSASLCVRQQREVSLPQLPRSSADRMLDAMAIEVAASCVPEG